MTIELLNAQVTHDGRPLVDVPRLRLEPGQAVTIVGKRNGATSGVRSGDDRRR